MCQEPKLRPFNLLTPRAYKFWIKNIPVKLDEKDWQSIWRFVDTEKEREEIVNRIINSIEEKLKAA